MGCGFHMYSLDPTTMGMVFCSFLPISLSILNSQTASLALRRRPVFQHGVYSCAALMDNLYRAIFGHYYTEMPNHIPLSGGISSRRMMCFFLIWLAHPCFAPSQTLSSDEVLLGQINPVGASYVGIVYFCVTNTMVNIGPLYSPSTGWKYEVVCDVCDQ